jgi:hypothetical protein
MPNYTANKQQKALTFTSEDMHINNTRKEENKPQKSLLDPAMNFKSMGQHCIP